MIQIMIDVKPETIQHIHAMLDNHRGLTFSQLAGLMLDVQVAYRLEVERMKPARPIVFAPNEYSADGAPFGSTF